MKRNQLVKGVLLSLLLALGLVLASCGPLSARVDIHELEAVVGVRHGMQINLADVPPTGVPVVCHGFAPVGVASIELYVNGGFSGRAANTAGPETHEYTYFTTEFSFEPDGPGEYDLVCRTHDHEGRTVKSADVTIFLIGELPTVTPTEPGVPTATPTETTMPPTVTPTHSATPTATGTPMATPTETLTPTPTSTPTTPPPPTIVSLVANPSSILDGQCTTISWLVEGAKTAIYFDGEPVGHDDHRDRCPTATRDYELRAEGPGGQSTASVTVSVTPQGPDISQITAPGLMNWPDAGCPPGTPNQANISASITDPSGVSGAKVVYRVLRGSMVGEWRNLPMSELRGRFVVTITGEALQASLNPPADYYNDGTLQYYIEAFDGLGNSSQSGTGTVTIEWCVIVT